MSRTAWVIAVASLLIMGGQPGMGQLNRHYFIGQGHQLILQAKYTESVAMLSQLIGADSSVADAWFLRGVAKFYLNDMLGAKADLSASLRHNPVFSQAYLYRGIASTRMNRLEDALADFDAAIDLRPSSPDAFYSRGIAHLLMGNPLRAIEDLGSTILLEPKAPDPWINRGTAKLMMGDTLGALADYQRAISLNPSYAEPYGKRGRLFLEMELFAMALSDLNLAVQHDPTSTAHLFLRAIAHSELGDAQKAIDDLNQVLRINPQNALSLYNRALLHWREGNRRDALSDLDRASELSPDNILIHYNLGVLLLELGQPSEAARSFTYAIDLFPDFANAYLGRAMAYRRLQRPTEAERDYVFAQSITAKFSDRHSTPWTDTTKRFDRLVAFSADFAPRTTLSLLDDFASTPVDILPFMRLTAVRRESLNTLTQPLDMLNRWNEQLEGTAIRLVVSTSKRIEGEVAVDADRHPTEALLLSALRHGAEGHFNLAIAAYTEALGQAPFPALILLNLAAEKAEMQRFIASFQEEVGSIALSQTIRARHRASSNVPQALTFNDSFALLAKALAAAPNTPAIHYNLGNLYALSGRAHEAVGSYSQALSLAPSLGEAWYNRGLLHLMLRETEAGCRDMSAAGELGIRQAYLIIHRFCRRM